MGIRWCSLRLSAEEPTPQSVHEILQESSRHEIDLPAYETDLQELEPI
jgi:hypothetical protein